MRSLKAAVLLALGAALASPTPAADEKIAAKPVTYTELGKLVRGYKGKVVVVDFWSVY
jgi:hypothetical protein